MCAKYSLTGLAVDLPQLRSRTPSTTRVVLRAHIIWKYKLPTSFGRGNEIFKSLKTYCQKEIGKWRWKRKCCSPELSLQPITTSPCAAYPSWLYEHSYCPPGLADPLVVLSWVSDQTVFIWKYAGKEFSTESYHGQESPSRGTECQS